MFQQPMMLNKLQYRSPAPYIPPTSSPENSVSSPAYCDVGRSFHNVKQRVDFHDAKAGISPDDPCPKVLHTNISERHSDHSEGDLPLGHISGRASGTDTFTNVDSPSPPQLPVDAHPLRTDKVPSFMNAEQCPGPISLRKLSWESFKKNVYNPNKAKYASFSSLAVVQQSVNHASVVLCKKTEGLDFPSQYTPTEKQERPLNDDSGNETCPNEEIQFTPCGIVEICDKKLPGTSTEETNMIDPFLVATVASPIENECGILNIRSTDKLVSCENKDDDSIQNSEETNESEVCRQSGSHLEAVPLSITDSVEVTEHDRLIGLLSTCGQSTDIPTKLSDWADGRDISRSYGIPDDGDVPTRSTRDQSTKITAKQSDWVVPCDISRSDATLDGGDVPTSSTCDLSTSLLIKRPDSIDGCDISRSDVIPDQSDVKASVEERAVKELEETDPMHTQNVYHENNVGLQESFAENTEQVESVALEPKTCACIMCDDIQEQAAAKRHEANDSSGCVCIMCEGEVGKTDTNTATVPRPCSGNGEVKHDGEIAGESLISDNNEAITIPPELQAVIANKPFVLLNRLTNHDLEKYSKKGTEFDDPGLNLHANDVEVPIFVRRHNKAVATRGRGRPRKTRPAIINSIAVPSLDCVSSVENVIPLGNKDESAHSTVNTTDRSMSFWETSLSNHGDIYDFTDEHSNPPTATLMVDPKVMSMSSVLQTSYDTGKRAEERVFKSVKYTTKSNKYLLKRPTAHLDLNKLKEKFKKAFVVKPSLPNKKISPVNIKQQPSILNSSQIRDLSPPSLDAHGSIEDDSHRGDEALYFPPLVDRWESESVPIVLKSNYTSDDAENNGSGLYESVDSGIDATNTLPVLRQMLASKIPRRAILDDIIHPVECVNCPTQNPADYCWDEQSIPDLISGDPNGAPNEGSQHLIQLTSEKTVNPKETEIRVVRCVDDCELNGSADIPPTLMAHVPTDDSYPGTNAIGGKYQVHAQIAVDVSVNSDNANVIKTKSQNTSDTVHSEKDILSKRNSASGKALDSNGNSLSERQNVVHSTGYKGNPLSLKIPDEIKQQIACRARMFETIRIPRNDRADESPRDENDPYDTEGREGQRPAIAQANHIDEPMKALDNEETCQIASDDRDRNIAECQHADGELTSDTDDRNKTSNVSAIAESDLSVVNTSVIHYTEVQDRAEQIEACDNQERMTTCVLGATIEQRAVDPSDTHDVESGDGQLMGITDEINKTINNAYNAATDRSDSSDVNSRDVVEETAECTKQMDEVANTTDNIDENIDNDQSAADAAEGLLFLAGNCGRVVKSPGYISGQAGIQGSTPPDCSTEVSGLAKVSTTEIQLRITSVEGSASKFYSSEIEDTVLDSSGKNVKDSLLGGQSTVSSFPSVAGTEGQIQLPAAPLNAYFVISPVTLTQPVPQRGRHGRRRPRTDRTLRTLLPKSPEKISSPVVINARDASPAIDIDLGLGKRIEETNDFNTFSQDATAHTPMIAEPSGEKALDLSLKCSRERAAQQAHDSGQIIEANGVRDNEPNDSKTSKAYPSRTLSLATEFTGDCLRSDVCISSVPPLTVCTNYVNAGPESFKLNGQLTLDSEFLEDPCRADTVAVDQDRSSSSGSSSASSPAKPSDRLNTIISSLRKDLQVKKSTDNVALETPVSRTTDIENVPKKSGDNGTRKKKTGRRSASGYKRRKCKKSPKTTEPQLKTTPTDPRSSTTGGVKGKQKAGFTKSRGGKKSSRLKRGRASSPVTKVFYTRSKAKSEIERGGRIGLGSRGRGKGRGGQSRKKGAAVSTKISPDIKADGQENRNSQRDSPITDIYSVVMSRNDEDNNKILLRKSVDAKVPTDMDHAEGSLVEEPNITLEKLGRNKRGRAKLGKGKRRKKAKKAGDSFPKSLEDYTGKFDGEDADELPTILPPKRRRMQRKHQHPGALEQTATSDEDNIARLTREFPRHNWLENKIKSISTAETPPPQGSPLNSSTPHKEQEQSPELPSKETNNRLGLSALVTEESPSKGDRSGGNSTEEHSESRFVIEDKMILQRSVPDGEETESSSPLKIDQSEKMGEYITTGRTIRFSVEQSMENQDSHTKEKLPSAQSLSDTHESTASPPCIRGVGEAAVVLSKDSERSTLENIVSSGKADLRRDCLDHNVMDLSIRKPHSYDVSGMKSGVLKTHSLPVRSDSQDDHSDATTILMEGASDDSDEDESKLTIDQTVAEQEDITVTPSPTVISSPTTAEDTHKRDGLCSPSNQTDDEIGLDPGEEQGKAAETVLTNQGQPTFNAEPQQSTANNSQDQETVTSAGPIDLCTKSSDFAAISPEGATEQQNALSNAEGAVQAASKLKQKPPVLKVHPQIQQQSPTLCLELNKTSILTATKEALSNISIIPDAPNSVESRSRQPLEEHSGSRGHNIPPVPALVPIFDSCQQLCDKTPLHAHSRHRSGPPEFPEKDPQPRLPAGQNENSQSLSGENSGKSQSLQSMPETQTSSCVPPSHDPIHQPVRLHPSPHNQTKRSLSADASGVFAQPAHKKSRMCSDNNVDYTITDPNPVGIPSERKHNGQMDSSGQRPYTIAPNESHSGAVPIIQNPPAVSVELNERCKSLENEIEILEQLAKKKATERDELLQLQVQKKAEKIRCQEKQQTSHTPNSTVGQAGWLSSQRSLPYPLQESPKINDFRSNDRVSVIASSGNTNNNNVRKENEEGCVSNKERQRRKELRSSKGVIDLSIKQKVSDAHTSSPLPAHMDASVDSVWSMLALSSVPDSRTGSSNCPYIKSSAVFHSPHVETNIKLGHPAHPAHSQQPFETAGFLITPLPSGSKSYTGHRPPTRRKLSRTKSRSSLHPEQTASSSNKETKAQHVSSGHLQNKPPDENLVSVCETNGPVARLPSHMQDKSNQHMTLPLVHTAQAAQGTNQIQFLGDRLISVNESSNGNKFYEYADLSRSPENVIRQVTIPQGMHFGSPEQHQHAHQREHYPGFPRSALQDQSIRISAPHQPRNQRTVGSENMIQQELNTALAKRKFQPNGQPAGQHTLCPVNVSDQGHLINQQRPGSAVYHHKLIQPRQVTPPQQIPPGHPLNNSRSNIALIDQNAVVKAANFNPGYAPNVKADSGSASISIPQISPQAERREARHLPQGYPSNPSSSSFRPELLRGNPRFVGPRAPHPMQYIPPHTGANSGQTMMHQGMHVTSTASSHPPQLMQALTSPPIRQRMTFMAMQQRMHGTNGQVQRASQNSQQLHIQSPSQMPHNSQIAFSNQAQSTYRPQQQVSQYSQRMQGPVPGMIVSQGQPSAQNRMIDLSGGGLRTTWSRPADPEAHGGVSRFSRPVGQTPIPRQSPQGGDQRFYLQTPHGNGSVIKHVQTPESGGVSRHNISAPDSQMGTLTQANCCECGREAAMVCSRCEGVRYCSKTCQINGWPRHGPHCKPKQ